jgi:hypothetical protein
MKLLLRKLSVLHNGSTCSWIILGLLSSLYSHALFSFDQEISQETVDISLKRLPNTITQYFPDCKLLH